MLWLALHFPQLPIDRQAGVEADIALAIVRQDGPRRQLLASNATAQALGIHAGLALSSAYAIVPELVVQDYDEEAERRHLEQLTLWALNYSSRVTPHPPDTLLIEIEASLRLFGGLEALLETIEADIERQQLTVRRGVAPTPAAAKVLARAGVKTPAIEPAALAEALADLPLGWLDLDEFTHKGLRQSGIRHLGQLMALPPASLTRRFGHHCTDLLYRLDGRLPDPQTAFEAPQQFRESVDLPLEAPDTQALAFSLNRLLGALGGFLRSHDQGVRHLDITLSHHRHPPTVVTLRFLEATASVEHLYRVASERLADTCLPAAVIRLGLASCELAGITREGRDLFRKSRSQTRSIEQVLDTLMARLGRKALYTALPGDDHRPEKAWLSALLDKPGTSALWPARPLWMLSEAHLASEPLILGSSAERIENGWWGETDVRRDYYIAHNASRQYFWVYRLRGDPDRIWIHGIFS